MASELIKFVKNGNIKAVADMINIDPDLLNARDKDGRTALHFASWCNDINITKYLLKQGIYNDVKDKDGRTPLHFAAKYGFEDMVSILLGARAIADIQDFYGDTSLHCACSRGHVGVALLLLKKGASKNITNNLRSTPLHYAAYYGNVCVALTLLKHGADQSILDKDKKSFLDVAKDEQVKRMLEEYLSSQRDNEYMSMKEMNEFSLQTDGDSSHCTTLLSELKSVLKRFDDMIVDQCSHYTVRDILNDTIVSNTAKDNNVSVMKPSEDDQYDKALQFLLNINITLVESIGLREASELREYLDEEMMELIRSDLAVVPFGRFLALLNHQNQSHCFDINTINDAWMILTDELSATTMNHLDIMRHLNEWKVETADDLMFVTVREVDMLLSLLKYVPKKRLMKLMATCHSK